MIYWIYRRFYVIEIKGLEIFKETILAPNRDKIGG